MFLLAENIIPGKVRGKKLGKRQSKRQNSGNI